MKPITVAILIAVSSSFVQAQSIKKQADEANKKIGAAMLKKDFKTLGAMMKAHVTKDFQYIETGVKGKPQTADQMIANMTMGMSTLTKVTTAGSKVLTVKASGKNGSGTTKHWLAGTMVGPDKKTHEMLYEGTTVDTYVLDGKTWKLSKMVWTTTKMAMDGKPMAPPKM